MPAHPETHYIYVREGTSYTTYAHDQMSPMGAWNYAGYSSLSPQYPSYPVKQLPLQQHYDTSNEFGGWSHEHGQVPLSDQSHVVLEESYARGYPSYDDDASHSAGFQTPGQSYDYHDQPRLLYADTHPPNPNPPRLPPGSWFHPTSPVISHSNPGPSSPAVPIQQPSHGRLTAGTSPSRYDALPVIIPAISHFDQYEYERETEPSTQHGNIGSSEEGATGSPLSAISSPSPSPSPISYQVSPSSISLSPPFASLPPPSNPLPLSRRPPTPVTSLSEAPAPRTTATTPSPISKSAETASTGKTQKICSHCHATSTPLWRREPGTLKPLCNACGLYLQQRNKLRPQILIDADNDKSDDADDGSQSGEEPKGGPECSHCHTRTTSVWRRSKTGDQLCNACGVYSRLRGKDRPLSLKKNKIKPRTKHAKLQLPQ